MRFPAPSFFSAVEQVANKIFVEVMFTTELCDGHAHSIEVFACLIRCKGGVHSGRPCSNVFMY